MSELTTIAPALAGDTPATNRPARADGLLQWYAIGVLATTISTFLYLAAVRNVIATGTASESLRPAATLLWLNGVGAPLLVLVRGLVIALTAWAVMTLFDEPISYRHCLRAAWKAEVALAAWLGVQGLIALARGAATQPELLVPLGIDLVWTPQAAALAVLSHAVNLFFVGWLAIIWRELRRSSVPAPRGRTVGIAVAAVAVVSLGIQVARFV